MTADTPSTVAEGGEVGGQGSHGRGVGELREHDARSFTPTVTGSAPSAVARPGGVSTIDRFGRREVELDHVADHGADELAAPRVWNRAGAPGARRPVSHEHVRARERRVAAQLDLDGRREPPQAEPPSARGDDERRLREVHLGRDLDCIQAVGDRLVERGTPRPGCPGTARR